MSLTCLCRCRIMRDVKNFKKKYVGEVLSYSWRLDWLVGPQRSKKHLAISTTGLNTFGHVPGYKGVDRMLKSFRKILDICQESKKVKTLRKSYRVHEPVVKRGQIPPKKSRGNVHKGEEVLQIPEESVYRIVTKKKATISVDDNIVPEPDIALELGKSSSLTEAKEEAAARQVHATHRRIVSESVPEPARRRQSDIAVSETTKKLKGIQTLTPAEQEAADVMKALKDSRRMLGRQSGTGGSDEGIGEIPGVPDESIFTDAEDDNEETESDSNDIYKYRINVRKNVDTDMKDAKMTADITKETTEQLLTSSSFFVLSDYGNQFLNLSYNKEIFEQPLGLQQITPIPTTITTPPINTEAPAITTAIPEITPFIALQLKNRKLICSSFQTLERHTAYLVEKYSVLPTPESSKKQESEKSPEEIIIIKREQEEKKHAYKTISLLIKLHLKNFVLKDALLRHTRQIST
ncbi:hypothetical protein Tco_0721836 [Tanacetum coccineum]